MFCLFLIEAAPVDRHDVSKPDCPTLGGTGGHANSVGYGKHSADWL